MKKRLFPFVIVVGVFSIYSCKTKIQAFTLQRDLVQCDTCQYKNFKLKPGVDKAISILNGSFLQYTVLQGDIGATTEIRYIQQGNHLIVDTMDVYKRNKFQGYSNEILGETIIYTADSLTSPALNEKYNRVKRRK